MNPVVVGNAQWLAWLTTLTASGAPLFGAIMHLFKTLIPVNQNTPLGSFVEADFTGYAAGSAITWGTPFYTSAGVPVVTGTLNSFVTGSPATVLNTIYGWYLTDSGGTTLLVARLLDTPIILTGPHQGFEIIPCYPAYISQ